MNKILFIVIAKYSFSIFDEGETKVIAVTEDKDLAIEICKKEDKFHHEFNEISQEEWKNIIDKIDIDSIDFNDDAISEIILKNPEYDSELLERAYNFYEDRDLYYECEIIPIELTTSINDFKPIY